MTSSNYEVNLKPQKRTYAWRVLAAGAASASGILLLPVLSRYLGKDELGLWFVFLTLGSLVQLLDFGFKPTIVRSVSLSLSGAREIVKEGLACRHDDSNNPNLDLLYQIAEAAKLIYRQIAVWSSVLMMGPILIYVCSLTSALVNQHLLILAWLIYAVSAIINFYYGYASAVLEGAALQNLSYQALTLSLLLSVLFSVVALVLGFGLIGLSVSALLGATVLRILLVRSLNKHFALLVPTATSDLASIKILTKKLWFNSKRLGATQIGAFLIHKASLLVAASFLGLAASASYSLTLSLFLAASSLSQSFVNVNIPYFAQLRQASNHVVLKKAYFKSALLSLSICFLAFAGIVLFGSRLLAAFGSETLLLPLQQSFLLSLVMLLEVNHGIAATFITTANTVPFVKPAIYSGLAILVLSVLTTPVYGVLALILSQGIAQLAFNNWYWPLYVYNSFKRMHISDSVLS
jgi:O-antigen/teichoic acid export membrane protein